MLWLSLSVVLWGLLHSLFASHRAKEFSRRVVGERIARYYRLAYNIFAGFSFLPVLVLAVNTPDRILYLVPLPWSALMVIGQLLAVLALLAGFRQTDPWDFFGLRQLADPALSGPEGGAEARPGLVTSGLYRYVRHPLYSAGLAFIWLMPLMTVNLLIITSALSVYVIIGAIFEERKLLHVFGQAYADYATKTPMLIPFTKGNKTRRRPSI